MSTLKFEYRVLVSGPNGFEEKSAFQHEAPREAAVNRRPEANSFPSWSTRTWPRLTKSGPLGLGLASSDPLVSIAETHARVRAVREAAQGSLTLQPPTVQPSPPSISLLSPLANPLVCSSEVSAVRD